jgi:hypothetical protein
VVITYKVNQTISFSGPTGRTLGTDPFTVAATASSGLAVTFSSGTPGVCTTSGTNNSTVTLVAAGTCTIRADQAGNTDDYNAAPQESIDFTVSPELLITTPSSGLAGTFNSAYSLTMNASGGATPRSFSLVSGTLPAGLSLNSSTGVISGTPTTVENRTIQIRVTDANSATATTSSFTISIAAAPLAPPSTPTVAPTAGTLKSFGVLWSEVTNASSYEVRVYASNGSTLLQTIPNLSETFVTVNSSNFGSISDAVDYRIAVVAVGTGNYTSGAESSKASVKTNSQITFDSNGGTGTLSPQIVATGVGTQLLSNTFDRQNFTFRSWNTLANGTGTNYNDGAQFTATGNVTLYAMWTSLEDRAWQGASALQRTSTTIPPRFYTNSTPVPTANNQSFTAEAWVYHDERSGNQAIFGGGQALNSVTDRFYLGVNESGNMGARVGGKVYLGVSEATIPTGRWTHVAATVTATNTVVSFWINGTLVHTSPDLGTRNPIGSIFSVGDSNTDAEIWRGQIDQVKIWGIALNDVQIRESMHSYQKGAIETANAPLLAHYDFNEFIEGVEPNRAGSSHNLISSNSGGEYIDNRIIETSIAHTLQNVVKFNRSYLTAAGGWTPPDGVSKFKALVVGGGGSGGTRHAGGGGAGALLYSESLTISGATRIQVGQGGLGLSIETTNSQVDLSGQSGQSSFLGAQELKGGGGGGGGTGAAKSGGSGGGTNSSTNPNNAGSGLGLKNSGGAGAGQSGGQYTGGGGGGAMSVGANSDLTQGGQGGSGYVSNITGQAFCFAAGGGGGATPGALGGVGGSCTSGQVNQTVLTTAGFGTNVSFSGIVAGSGESNSGSGGGAGGLNSTAGRSGSGGSGVVILSYGPELEIATTPRAARVGTTFSDPITVRVRDANDSPAHAGQVVTLSAANSGVLRLVDANGNVTTPTSVTATTNETGTATFTGLGFQSDVTTTQTLTVTSDAYIGTSLQIEPRFVASTVSITDSGETQGVFVDGVFQSSQSGSANILNTDLQTAMASESVLVESSGPINIAASVVSNTSGAGVTFKANLNVIVSNGVQLTTNNGNIVFWSRAAALNNPASQATEGRIEFGNSVTVNSNGGAIILAGSSSVDANGFPNGAAFTNASSGVRHAISLGTDTSLGDVQLLSGGGQIRLSAQTGSSALQAFAGKIGTSNKLIVDSGPGRQDWSIIGGNSGDNTFEVWNGSFEVISSADAAELPAINLYVRNTGNGNAVIQQTANGTSTFMVTGTGDLNVDVSTTGSGLAIDDFERIRYLANGGDIRLNFGTTGVSESTASDANPVVIGALSGQQSTSNVTIKSGTFGTVGTSNNGGIIVRTSGTVAVEPSATSFSAAQTFDGTWSFIDNSGLTFGKALNTANITISSANTAAGNLAVIGGAVTVNAAQTTINGGNITVTASGNYSSTSSGTLNSDGAASIESTGGTVSTLAITAISNVVVRSSGNATVGGATSAGGSVLVESGGTTALNDNISAGAQGILVKSVSRITTSAGSNLNTPRRLETSGGDITLWTTNASSGGVTFNNWALIDSSGGDITIGGGEASSDTSRPAGNATSSSGSAIVLGASNSDDVVKITTGSGKGNISIKGEATSTSAHSGIFFRAGVKIIGETVSLYGKSRYSSSTGFDAAGIYHYTGASTATTLIEATGSYQTHREALVIESEAMSSTHAMMLGNDANGRTFNTVTIRTSGNYADIRFTGISGRGGSGTGVWMAGAVMETYTGDVLIDSPSSRVLFSKSESGRQVTYRPTVVGFGGDITIRSLGRDSGSEGKFDVQTAGNFSFIPPAGGSFNTPQTFPLTGSSFSVGGLVVGSTDNTADLTVGAVVQSTGAVTYRGGTITQSFNVTSDTGSVTFASTGTGKLFTKTNATITAGQDVTILSANSTVTTGTGAITAGTAGLDSAGVPGEILVKAGQDILTTGSLTTSGGAITLWSDSDNVNEGGILVGSGAAINSNGGDVTLGGGNGATAADGYAKATANINSASNSAYSGIRLIGSISAGAGDVVLRGQDSSKVGTTSHNSGIEIEKPASISTTSGNIDVEGTLVSGTMTSTGNHIGLLIGWGGTASTGTNIISSTSGDISLKGFASPLSNAKAFGLWLTSNTVQTVDGDIFLNSSAGATVGTEFRFHGATVSSTNGSVFASTGTSSGTATFDTSGTITAGTAVSLGVLRPTFTSLALNGVGHKVVEPPSGADSFAISVNTANLTVSNLSSSLRIGKTGNTADLTIGRANSIAGNLDVIGGAVTISTNQATTNSGNITITPSGTYGGNGTLNSAGTLTISGGTTVAPRAAISAAGDISISSSSSFNNSSAPITSSSGSISISSTNSFASIQAAVTSTLKNVSITVERTVINAAVKAIQGVVAIQPSTANRDIKITSDLDDNALSIPPAELERIEAETLRLTNSGTGNISFEVGATLTGKVNNLAIRAGQNVTAGSGVVVLVANLGIEAGGTIDWPGTGGEASVIALNASSVTFNQSANYSVAAVDGIDPEFGLGVKFVMEGVDRTKTVDRFMAVTFNPPPVVKIQDKYGNVLASNNLSAADYTVTAAMSFNPNLSPAPSLTGDVTTRSGGTHTFENLRVIDGTGAVSISFTVTRDSDDFDLVDAESSDTPQATAVVINYLVKAGFPSSIDISMQSSTLAGKTGLSPTATLKDSSGGTLTTGDYANATVTVAVSTDTQRIQIESGGSAQASNGVATFSNLVIGGLVGEDYVLTFSVQYLDGDNVTQTVTRDSGPFDLFAGDATALSVSSSSQTVASRVNLSDVVVTVEDVYGNPVVSSASRPISLEVGTGANGSAKPTLIGYNGTPVGTALNGSSATFTGLQLQGKVDSYDLTFSSSGLSSTVHRVDLTHGEATNLTITGPANAANDKDFDTDVVVSIFDADDNLVTTGDQSTQTVALTSATTLTGTREVSASGGIATFTADTLRLIGTQGSKTVTATVLSPSSITADLSVLLGFGDATQLVLTTQAAGIANRITFVTDPVITVQDSSGNTVTDYSVDIDVTGAAVGGVNGSLVGDVDIAPSFGVATFTDLELQGEVGQYDLTFSSGDLATATQRVTLTHGAAFDVVVSGPSEADNALDFGSEVSVVLRDQDQNIVTSGPDSSRSVVASNADANTVLSGTTAVSATAGRATFTNLRLTGPVGQKTVALTWVHVSNTCCKPKC